jgi:outer membrane biosynthesis protein TonB
MKTVKKWKFQPALLGGISVESIARIPVRFELENGALR